MLWKPLILDLAAVVVTVLVVVVQYTRSALERVEPVASWRLAWASL